MSQVPEVIQLLPVETPTDHSDATHTNDFLFEPSPKDVLGAILPLYINFRVFQSLVEARASEHSARMVAMKSATDNAKKFIKELTLEYNKLRQGAITAELLEITTAMKAME
jgi:F-type H+-transporting ATPase subunit gamma